MHIAFLTPEYPHSKIAHSAGIGTSIKNLVVELVKNQHNATVFVYGVDTNEVFNDNGITIHKIAYKKYAVFSWYLYRKHIQNYINNTIKNTGIQLIEAPDWTGITAFMKFKCPLLLRLHGTDAYFCALEGRKQKFKNYFFEKIALKSANNIASVSEFAANKTKSIFNIKKSIRIIPNGIDVGKFNNDSLEIFNKNTVLYFGTIIRKKGIIELAYIFNELIELNSDVKLILIGNDSEDIETGLKSTFSIMQNILSKKAKPKVEYIGKVPYHLLNEHIKNAHICVFPSLAETFGMVTIEAMAMQKVVVTGNFGWNKGIVDDGLNGYLRNPKNHYKFAQTINELLNDKNKSIKIGGEAKRKVECCFDIKYIAKQNIALYQSIIKAK